VLPRSIADPDVLVGPGLGRDAAAISIGGRVVVAKSDPITFVTEGGATHLVEVNANDVACLGATPRWLLVSSLLPQGVTPADVLNQFAELREACRHRSVELVGGHTEIVPGLEKPMLVGMMLGVVAADQLLEPGQAQPGDALLLTKGLAIEGTAVLARERQAALTAALGADVVRSAAGLMQTPGISIVADAKLALETGGVSALHDPTESGLATAVRELAEASGAGAQLDANAIPVLAETRAVADAMRIDPLGMLASGSLLIAANPDAVPAITDALATSGINATVIGQLTKHPGEFFLRSPHGERPLPDFAVDEVARVLHERTDRDDTASGRR
jgi:hydrogenase maturation factor